MSDPLHVWVIYRNPADYPGRFVLRQHLISAGAVTPTDEVFVSERLITLRRIVLRRGLYRLLPDDSDPEIILETWL